ncbi:heavy-metal-associated domain-containing protein [Edaphobacter aggregans]|uniref:Heavy-metal-associated domain-containing protein n=1 Tax=Edaphobacter aggregans TaxID=570835 RepID=A0A428MHU0_9BACT|nr:heavy metal-associated domain-containing protein [Edaphobacter aggregans]RSL16437.1 heavy-metal-associated domain-containing protein [Edaphobacter aggregans]
MKRLLTAGILAISSLAAHAEYEQINLTVFGMDCAPCAHAIHVSMKGIQGVDKVDVDLNTGLVVIKLTPDNSAAMRQFNQAVEKNGFTHKDATVIARGKLTGTVNAPFFEVTGTQDRFALVPAATGLDIAALLGKTVTVTGVLPQAPKGRVSDTLRYNTITEAQ